MDENQIDPKVVQPTVPTPPVQPGVPQPMQPVAQTTPVQPSVPQPMQPVAPTPPVQPGVPQPVAQTTNTASSTAVNPAPRTSEINIRSHLWYAVGIVFGIGLLANIPSVGSFIALAALIYSIVLSNSIVKELKISVNETISKKIALTLGLGLIITQAIMYYRLRKHNLEIAKAINSFGWIIFGIATLFNIALTILLSAFVFSSV